MYTFHAETPIYLQLMEVLKGQIAAGKQGPGEKIASIRELAAFYTVNPNTVQRALQELEREGLIHTQRANGKTITEDAGMIHALRENLAAERMETCLSALDSLGFSQEEMTALFERTLKKRQGEAL